MKRGFVLHHNGPPASCLGQPHTRCVAFWAAVKAYHMSPKPNDPDGWSDIAYSFGVCPHGIRLEGRGWFKNQFAGGDDVVGTDDGPDSAWFSVLVFLGGTEKPTDAMVAGVVDLIGEGRSTGRCGLRVLPHNAFKVKPCPGPEFTALAKAWDNQSLPNQEDDMTPQECETVVRNELRRALAFVTTGAGNALTGGQDWAAQAVTLPKLLAAVAEDSVDVETIVAGVLAGLDAPAIAEVLAEAIPDELGQDVADILAARLAG